MERSDSDLLRTSGLGSIEMMPPSPFAANSQDYVIVSSPYVLCHVLIGAERLVDLERNGGI